MRGTSHRESAASKRERQPGRRRRDDPRPLHWVATEYGTVNLFGLNLRERAAALMSIAHPDARGELRRAFAEIRHIDLGEGRDGERGARGVATTAEPAERLTGGKGETISKRN